MLALQWESQEDYSSEGGGTQNQSKELETERKQENSLEELQKTLAEMQASMDQLSKWPPGTGGNCNARFPRPVGTSGGSSSITKTTTVVPDVGIVKTTVVRNALQQKLHATDVAEKAISAVDDFQEIEL